MKVTPCVLRQLLHAILGQGQLGEINGVCIEGLNRTGVVVIIELFQLTTR